MQAVGNAHGEDTGKAQRQPAGKNIAHVQLLRQQHPGQRQQGHHQSLHAVEPQPIHITGKTINQQNLNGEGQSAADEEKVPHIDGRNAHEAQKIQPNQSQNHAEHRVHPRPPVDEYPQHRHQHDVHGGEKTRLARVGVDQTDLLQAGGNEQRAAADSSRDPQPLVFPLCQRFPDPNFKIENQREQKEKNHSQAASDRLKGKRTDKVHANALGDESQPPDGCAAEQREGSAQLFFHINHQCVIYHI